MGQRPLGEGSEHQVPSLLPISLTPQTPSLQVLSDRGRDPTHYLWHHGRCQHPQLPGPQPLVSALPPPLTSLLGGVPPTPHHGGHHPPAQPVTQPQPLHVARATSPPTWPRGPTSYTPPLSPRSCWLVWRPSLGAFYIPVALILLITWIYFLCAGLRLRGPLAQSPKRGTGRISLEPGEELRGSTRLRSSGPLLSDSGSLLAAGSTGVVTPGPPEDGDGLYSPGVHTARKWLHQDSSPALLTPEPAL